MNSGSADALVVEVVLLHGVQVVQVPSVKNRMTGQGLFHLSKVWIAEYLPLLLSRQTWHDMRDNVKISDLVLTVDESAPRGSWPLGLVVNVVI